MTEAQIKALVLLMMYGQVFSGTDVIRGRVVRTRSNTLRALARQGFCALEMSPDGDLMAVRP